MNNEHFSKYLMNLFSWLFLPQAKNQSWSGLTWFDTLFGEETWLNVINKPVLTQMCYSKMSAHVKIIWHIQKMYYVKLLIV